MSEEIIARLKEWKNLIKHQNGTGIFGWGNIDEKVYDEIMLLTKENADGVDR